MLKTEPPSVAIQQEFGCARAQNTAGSGGECATRRRFGSVIEDIGAGNFKAFVPDRVFSIEPAAWAAARRSLPGCAGTDGATSAIWKLSDRPSCGRSLNFARRQPRRDVGVSAGKTNNGRGAS